MKTINTNEEIPEYFYVFLNFRGIYDKANERNYNLTKKITSTGFSNLNSKLYSAESFLNGDIDYLPFKSKGEYNYMISSFMMNRIHNYNIEYNLERYRKLNRRNYPSRFSGIFAFGDYETCRINADKNNWNINEVKKFRLLRNERFNKVAKLNMEIVSLLNGINISAFSIKNQDYIYNTYWSGGGSIQVEDRSLLQKEPVIHNSGVIYEYLIEGCLEEVE